MWRYRRMINFRLVKGSHNCIIYYFPITACPHVSGISVLVPPHHFSINSLSHIHTHTNLYDEVLIRSPIVPFNFQHLSTSLSLLLVCTLKTQRPALRSKYNHSSLYFSRFGLNRLLCYRFMIMESVCAFFFYRLSNHTLSSSAQIESDY